MISEALQRPIGPLAAWQWGVVIGGGYLGYRVLTGQGLFPSGGSSGGAGVTTGGAAIGDPGFTTGGSQGPAGPAGPAGATGATGASGGSSGGINTSGVCSPGYKAIAVGKTPSGQTYYACVPTIPTGSSKSGALPSIPGFPGRTPTPSPTPTPITPPFHLPLIGTIKPGSSAALPPPAATTPNSKTVPYHLPLPISNPLPAPVSSGPRPIPQLPILTAVRPTQQPVVYERPVIRP